MKRDTCFAISSCILQYDQMKACGCNLFNPPLSAIDSIFETIDQYGVEIALYLHSNSYFSAAEYTFLYDNLICSSASTSPAMIDAATALFVEE